MAKSIRSKVKKRLRTVKRSVIKKRNITPGTQQNERELRKEKKTEEALSGFLDPGKSRKNAFRTDDPDAEIPQHNWRQGPDFRSANCGISDAGLACWGTSRPKQKYGGDAPTASVEAHNSKPLKGDGGLSFLLRTSEQSVPWQANGKTKKRIKAAAKRGNTTEVGWGGKSDKLRWC